MSGQPLRVGDMPLLHEAPAVTIRQVERLSSGQVAARLGITVSTLRGYLCRARKERAAGRGRFSLMPEPDGRYADGSWWWYPETVDAWSAVRPGPGTRTDRFDAAARRSGRV